MKYVFPIVPANNGPIWLAAGVGILLLGVIILLAYTAFSSRNVRFEVDPSGLKISGDLYAKFIPGASILIDQISSLHLGRDANYRLKWRTNGVGMPGYSSGWFKLKNGEKALVFLTDQTRVVRIPTRDGYSVLMSVPEPDKFIQVCRDTFNQSG
jgi:hypothetical protein